MELFVVRYDSKDHVKRMEIAKKVQYIFASDPDTAIQITLNHFCNPDDVILITYPEFLPMPILIQEDEKKLPNVITVTTKDELNSLLLKYKNVYYIHSHRDMSTTTHKIYHQSYFPNEASPSFYLYRDTCNIDKPFSFYSLTNRVHSTGSRYEHKLNEVSYPCTRTRVNTITQCLCIMQNSLHLPIVIDMKELSQSTLKRIVRKYEIAPEGSPVYLYNKLEDKYYRLYIQVEQKFDDKFKKEESTNE